MRVIRARGGQPHGGGPDPCAVPVGGSHLRDHQREDQDHREDEAREVRQRGQGEKRCRPPPSRRQRARPTNRRRGRWRPVRRRSRSSRRNRRRRTHRGGAGGARPRAPPPGGHDGRATRRKTARRGRQSRCRRAHPDERHRVEPCPRQRRQDRVERDAVGKAEGLRVLRHAHGEQVAVRDPEELVRVEHGVAHDHHRGGAGDHLHEPRGEEGHERGRSGAGMPPRHQAGEGQPEERSGRQRGREPRRVAGMHQTRRPQERALEGERREGHAERGPNSHTRQPRRDEGEQRGQDQLDQGQGRRPPRSRGALDGHAAQPDPEEASIPGAEGLAPQRHFARAPPGRDEVERGRT